MLAYLNYIAFFDLVLNAGMTIRLTSLNSSVIFLYSILFLPACFETISSNISIYFGVN